MVGLLTVTCYYAMCRSERERFDQRFEAQRGFIAPTPGKKCKTRKKRGTRVQKCGALGLPTSEQLFPVTAPATGPPLHSGGTQIRHFLCTPQLTRG